MKILNSNENAELNIKQLYKIISVCQGYLKGVKEGKVDRPMLEALNEIIDTAEVAVCTYKGIKAYKNSKDITTRLRMWNTCRDCTCDKEKNKEARGHGWKRVIDPLCPVHGYLYDGSDSYSG